MKMTKVDSSNIAYVGYKDKILRVVFSHGKKYDYQNVPEEIFDYFLKAKSKGQFFHKFINKKYQFISK